MANLPAGLTLDEDQAPVTAGLPPGFEIDEDRSNPAASIPSMSVEPVQAPNRDAKANRADTVSFPWGTSDEATDTMSFGLAKKLGAGAISVLDAAGSAGTGGEFNPGERYTNQLEEYQAAQRLFGQEHPNMRLAGQGVGLGVSIARMPAVTVASGLGIGPKVANTIATGAAYGGVSGAAQDADSIEKRAKNTVSGGVIGGLLAPAAIPIAKGIGGLVGAIKEKAVNPTVQALKEFSQKGYEQAKRAGLVYSPEAYGRVVDDITAEAAERGIGKGDFASITALENPTVTSLIEKMNRLKSAPTGPTFTDAEIMRRVASDSKDPAAGMVAGKLRNMIDKAGKEDFISGNVDEGIAGINQGRENWARMGRAKVIDDAIESAKNAVGANYTTAGYQTALRQKFRAIADGDEFARWPKAEQEAILRVVRGAPVENFLRAVGRWSPKGPITGGIYGALAMKFPFLVAPVAATTTGARLAGTRLGVNAAKNAEMAVKGGKKVRPDTQGLEAITRALLAVQAGRVGGSIGSK